MSDTIITPPPPTGTQPPAPAKRPWYAKKRIIIPLALLVLFVIAGIAGGGSEDEPDTATVATQAPATVAPAASDPAAPTTAAPAATAPPVTEAAKPACQTGDGGDDTRNLCLFPDRPDKQKEDHEAELGGGVRLAGYTATVSAGQMVSQPFGEPCLVLDVTIENRDTSAQPYNVFDWKIQTPTGQVLDPGFCSYGQDTNLGSGDLVGGGTVSGTVGFEVPSGATYYVIYKPDAFNAVRGIWAVSV